MVDGELGRAKSTLDSEALRSSLDPGESPENFLRSTFLGTLAGDDPAGGKVEANRPPPRLPLEPHLWLRWLSGGFEFASSGFEGLRVDDVCRIRLGILDWGDLLRSWPIFLVTEDFSLAFLYSAEPGFLLGLVWSSDKLGGATPPGLSDAIMGFWKERDIWGNGGHNKGLYCHDTAVTRR